VLRRERGRLHVAVLEPRGWQAGRQLARLVDQLLRDVDAEHVGSAGGACVACDLSGSAAEVEDILTRDDACSLEQCAVIAGDRTVVVLPVPGIAVAISSVPRCCHLCVWRRHRAHPST
jgi:hypothetical protein